MAVTDTKFSICSAASALIGGPPVNDFEQGSDIAQKCKQLYEQAATNLLTMHPWQFNKQWAVMERHPDAPLTKWDAQYNFPNDCLEIRTVLVNDLPIDYECLGRAVFCNAVETDEVVIEYSRRADEADWPPAVVTVMIEFMTGFLASGHAERAALAKTWVDHADIVSLPLARHGDAQKITTRKMPGSKRLIGRR